MTKPPSGPKLLLPLAFIGVDKIGAQVGRQNRTRFASMAPTPFFCGFCVTESASAPDQPSGADLLDRVSCEKCGDGTCDRLRTLEVQQMTDTFDLAAFDARDRR